MIESNVVKVKGNYAGLSDADLLDTLITAIMELTAEERKLLLEGWKAYENKKVAYA